MVVCPTESTAGRAGRTFTDLLGLMRSWRQAGLPRTGVVDDGLRRVWVTCIAWSSWAEEEEWSLYGRCEGQSRGITTEAFLLFFARRINIDRSTIKCPFGAFLDATVLLTLF